MGSAHDFGAQAPWTDAIRLVAVAAASLLSLAACAGPGSRHSQAQSGPTSIAHGLRLHHPSHVADFRADGVRFRPRAGGPDWHCRGQ